MLSAIMNLTIKDYANRNPRSRRPFEPGLLTVRVVVRPHGHPDIIEPKIWFVMVSFPRRPMTVLKVVSFERARSLLVLRTGGDFVIHNRYNHNYILSQIRLVDIIVLIRIDPSNKTIYNDLGH